ncbi:MAG TPA: c-type cytochrome, partial [Candidatus Binatia bacterium]|nr:c-type cytochrome [Candidatus Binatia bacterium]
LARDDWGNRFLSWNTIPIRHEVIPERHLNSRISAAEGLHDLLPSSDTGEVFPLTPAPQTFNKESTSHFNALGGLTIYRGDALPSQYRGNAFVGETLRNLVHRRVLEPDGATFVARRAEQNKEFLASTDPWFHPVNFSTGPDGALYIIDFYRQWVEHPGYVPEKMRGQVAWRTGAEHGRIWRVRPRETKLKYPGSNLDLDRATTTQLLPYLEHANAWWRDTAQRLLVEKRDASAVPALKKIALKAQSPVARVQAVHALSALDALDAKTLLSALSDRHPRVREVAVGLSGYRLRHSGDLTLKMAGLADDRDPRVRLQVALSVRADVLGSHIATLEKLARRPDLDHLTALAIRSSSSARPWLLLQRLAADSSAPERLELIRALASDIGSTKNEIGEADGRALLDSLATKNASSPPENALALFAGLASGLAANEPDWRKRLREWAPDYERLIGQLVSYARNAAGRDTTSLPSRKLALTTLARAGTPDAVPALLEFLLPPHDEQIQAAAVSAINESGDPALFQAALSSWNRCQIATRRKLLAGAIRSTATVNILLDALEQGRVAPAELDASIRQNLLQTKSAELKARVKRLFDVPTDRATAIEQFTSALQLSGDRKAGADLFAKLCVQCHTTDGRGQNVGPSLTGISSRAPETLLVDILDPSRQVPSDFVSYTVTTSQGDTFTGLIMSENANAIVLRRPSVPDETIPRAQIKEVQASGHSLMPDGLETGLTPADLANLLDFLRSL